MILFFNLKKIQVFGDVGRDIHLCQGAGYVNAVPVDDTQVMMISECGLSRIRIVLCSLTKS